MKLLIYHNPMCSKSRGALKILEESGKKFEVRKYLVEPLSREEILEIIGKGVFFRDLYRGDGSVESEEELVEKLIRWPAKMQRPVIIYGEKAIIGRPIEKVLELIGQ